MKKILLFISAIILSLAPLNQTRAAGINYSEIASKTNGRYSANGIANFTQKLKNQYIPTLLANITNNFTSATPTVGGLKLGLEYTFDTSPKRAPMFMVSNGIEYLLSINLAKLSASGGEIIVDDQFYSNLNHELMHAVMFDITTAGMIGKRDWNQSGYPEIIDRLPMWFYEGIAQAAGGGKWHSLDLFTQIYPKTPENDRRTALRKWLDKHEWLGPTTYAQGWVATMYLGHIISGESTINGPAIARGLDKILIDLSNGYSFSQSISRQTNNRYKSLDDFNSKFADDGQDFTIKLVEAIGPRSLGSGSAIAIGGLSANGRELFYSQTGRSNFFELDISKIGAYDNAPTLAGKPVVTGGGTTKTEQLRRDGSINPDAAPLWPIPATPTPPPAVPTPPTPPVSPAPNGNMPPSTNNNSGAQPAPSSPQRPAMPARPALSVQPRKSSSSPSRISSTNSKPYSANSNQKPSAQQNEESKAEIERPPLVSTDNSNVKDEEEFTDKKPQTPSNNKKSEENLFPWWWVVIGILAIIIFILIVIKRRSSNKN